MPERATISNTSPLLYLHLVSQLDLLPQLYGQVLIPPAVQAELEAGAQRGINRLPPDTDKLLQNDHWHGVYGRRLDGALPLSGGHRETPAESVHRPAPN